jgi:hypothetical protein
MLRALPIDWKWTGNDLHQTRRLSQKGPADTHQKNPSDVSQRALAMFGAAAHSE